MHSPRFFSLALLGAALFFSACSKNSSSPTQPSATQGHLKVYLTDAPADADAVFITFSTIEANINGQWITVSGSERTVNLLEWNNGKTLLIGDADLGAGNYEQIRLMVTKAEIVVNGETHPLEIPSAEQTGLKLVHEFTIQAGSTYELVIDFNAQHSIVQTGNGRYMLKPVVRVTPLAVTGSISGTILAPGLGILATAYSSADMGDSDIVTSSPVDAHSGAFMLAFLQPGTYWVRIVDALGLSVSIGNVEVKAGQNTDLGSLILK